MHFSYFGLHDITGRTVNIHTYVQKPGKIILWKMCEFHVKYVHCTILKITVHVVYAQACMLLLYKLPIWKMIFLLKRGQFSAGSMFFLRQVSLVLVNSCQLDMYPCKDDRSTAAVTCEAVRARGWQLNSFHQSVGQISPRVTGAQMLPPVRQFSQMMIGKRQLLLVWQVSDGWEANSCCYMCGS